MGKPARRRFMLNGLVMDIAPHNVPPNFYSEAANMVPTAGGMARALGWSPIFPGALFPPYFVMPTAFGLNTHWIYAGISKLGVISPDRVHTDITPAGGLKAMDRLNPEDPDAWTGCNINGIAVINGRANSPLYWFEGIAGGKAMVLPGLRPGARYGVMRSYKYHLVGLDVADSSGNFGDLLHWSDAADPGQVPGTWVPAADNEAGDNILADEPGRILDGLTLRDSFMIYKQDSVYEMTYSGGAEVMRFRKVFSGMGILATHCVVAVKGTHIVLGNGDIWQHDGQNQKSLIDGKLRKTFFADIDASHFYNSFVLYDEAREEVWFCVPRTGESRPTTALVYSVTTSEFARRQISPADFGATGIVMAPQSSETWDTAPAGWDTDAERWSQQDIASTADSIILADSGGPGFFLGNDGLTGNGVAYPSFVSRTGLLMLQDERGTDSGIEMAIRRVWPLIEAAVPAVFTLEVFGQPDVMAPVQLLERRDFTPGREGVAVNSNCRYFGFRVSCQAAAQWRIAGIDVEFMQQGYF